MSDVPTLHYLVTAIDEAPSPHERDDLLDEFVGAIEESDDATLEEWLGFEENAIDPSSDLDGALFRLQAVTSALSLGANLVHKGATAVRKVLDKWIGRLQKTLTALKTAKGAAQVYLEVNVKAVTLGIAW